ncbi:CHASE2 domain-containing protein [Pseudomonas inefficax]|uniref:CHASE2 domain-containing protein n=1 Tax=Pseudomonas inefficax TaxID=2078786 RepID=UPI004046D59B
MTGHVKSEHWLAHLLSVCTHHLPAALMVAAVVFIFDHRLHWLKAIEGYAFLGIANVTAQDMPLPDSSAATVTLVLLDQNNHEDFYRGRNPLDRCQLWQDLSDIYALKPKLLVIDLDLSPGLPLLHPDGSEDLSSLDCDNKLQVLLAQSDAETHTVLIAPFPMLDAQAQQRSEKWRAAVGRVGQHVTFAEDPSISVNFGLVNDLDCNDDSVAATAFKVYRGDSPSNWPDNCLKKHANHRPPLIISPGQYLSGLRVVSFCQLSSRMGAAQCHDSRYEAIGDVKDKVVFVGASFGDGDTFLTPLGIMYGVEVHAAAFMSLLQPTTRYDLLAFSLDVLLGLVMGGLIDLSWRGYFSLRFSAKALERQAAPWLILLLAIGFVIVVGGLTVGSYLVLRYFSIWLSPLPMAVGMLIESFFTSAIGTAVKQGYEQRQALVRRLQASGPDSYASRLALEAEQRPHYAHTLQERAARFFYLDCARLWHREKPGAAVLLGIRRVAFFLVLLLAYYWDWFASLVKGFFH